MTDLLGKSAVLEGKIKKLIHLHVAFKAENSALKSDNQRLTETINKQQEHIQQLEEGNKALKLAQALIQGSENEDPTVLKGKINEMIRDIDKCLALLNK
ncbi:MAG TPA: hypothetical protein PL185_00860 [Flavobacteriales bacterium]|jgi:FtsZ-binding cell division protein ZapB|nr:hypothetical protein [Flavobacteriales bacterium]HPH81091.1 hypothetical protein [Flavobacteriales bacterium]